MTVRTAAEKLGLRIICGDGEREICGVYAGDLLSWVMSHLTDGEAWITIMSNVNVVAVASLTGAAAVILAEGVEPDPPALEAARERGITLLSGDMPVYELCAAMSSVIGESA